MFYVYSHYLLVSTFMRRLRVLELQSLVLQTKRRVFHRLDAIRERYSDNLIQHAPISEYDSKTPVLSSASVSYIFLTS